MTTVNSLVARLVKVLIVVDATLLGVLLAPVRVVVVILVVAVLLRRCI